MLRFITQKLLNKKWLILCILVGNILLVAIAACNPMYTRAALQKMLTKNMDQSLAEENRYPCMEYVTAKLSESRLQKYSSSLLPDYLDVAARLKKQFPTEPLEQVTLYYTSNDQDARFDSPRASELSSDFSMKIASMSKLEEHVEIISGNMYTDKPDSQGIIDCIVNETVYLSMDMVIGETFTMKTYTDVKGNPVQFRIAGVFRAKDTTDPYWVRQPLSFEKEFFISQPLYEEKFMTGSISGNVTGVWYLLFDYENIEIEQVDAFLAANETLKADFYAGGDLYTAGCTYDKIFQQFLKDSDRISTTMWILQVPILVLLAVFVFMVSSQVINIEAGEIAVLKSRGVSKLQLIGTYFIQSLIIAVFALAVGIPLGYLLCHVFGSTDAFLTFEGRHSMRVVVTLKSIVYAFGAALAGVLIMTLPVLRFARFSIVEQKANKRKSQKPMWQRMFLDFALLAISCYGFYNFNSQKDLLISKVAAGEALDPMLFLSASLFILSCAICFLRVIPILSYVFFKVGRKLWSPAFYASFLQITRDSRKQSFITVFLVLTIALGIFNANIARTVNENEEIRTRYSNGADLMLQEKWNSNEASYLKGYSDSVTYQEPTFNRYRVMAGELPEVKAVARVMTEKNAYVSANSQTVKDVHFMAIHTKDFGNSAWMPEGYSAEHWYHALNALSQRPDGAIISSNLAKQCALEVGDTLSATRFDVKNQQTGRQILTVAAIVDYWPGYENKYETKTEDGNVILADRYLIVTNLENILREFAVSPYQVWMKVDGDTEQVYKWLEEHEIKLVSAVDTSEDIDAMKNDPYFQVTNGMLTITFIVVLLLCAIGFLIYWVTSIRSRELIFGIYRAMGMSMRELIFMLINEHFFGSLLPIAFGAGIGVLASKLFVPLIEIAYSPSVQTLPTRIFSSDSDMLQIAIVVGAMLLFCIGVISYILSKIKINQALKLGED